VASGDGGYGVWYPGSGLLNGVLFAVAGFQGVRENRRSCSPQPVLSAAATDQLCYVRARARAALPPRLSPPARLLQPESGKPVSIAALILGSIQIAAVGVVGFFTVLFSSLCDAYDEYENHCAKNVFVASFYDTISRICAKTGSGQTRKLENKRHFSAGFDEYGREYPDVTESECVANGYTWGQDNTWCHYVGLLALCAVARFIFVTICLTSSCMGAKKRPF
jgi:hypothetical protein